MNSLQVLQAQGTLIALCSATHSIYHCLVRGSKIFSAFHLNKKLHSTLGMETDAQNDVTELAFSGCNSPVVSDAHAVRHTSTADLSSRYATCTATSMPFNQSSDFILSENLSMCVLDLKDPSFESESPQSLERNGDALACQSPQGSSSPSMSTRDVVRIRKKSPPNFLSQSLRQHCRTKSESRLDNFNHSNHNQFNTSLLLQSQYLSARSGYIIDCSGSGVRENGQTPATFHLCKLPIIAPIAAFACS